MRKKDVSKVCNVMWMLRLQWQVTVPLVRLCRAGLEFNVSSLLSLSLFPLSHSLTHFHTHYRNHCCRITSYPACFPSDSSSMATTVLPTPTNLPLPLLLHSSHLSFFIVLQNRSAQILLKQIYCIWIPCKYNQINSYLGYNVS